LYGAGIDFWVIIIKVFGQNSTTNVAVQMFDAPVAADERVLL
jgi:hypothetical protein